MPRIRFAHPGPRVGYAERFTPALKPGHHLRLSARMHCHTQMSEDHASDQCAGAEAVLMCWFRLAPVLFQYLQIKFSATHSTIFQDFINLVSTGYIIII